MIQPGYGLVDTDVNWRLDRIGPARKVDVAPRGEAPLTRIGVTCVA